MTIDVPPTRAKSNADHIRLLRTKSVPSSNRKHHKSIEFMLETQRDVETEGTMTTPIMPDTTDTALSTPKLKDPKDRKDVAVPLRRRSSMLAQLTRVLSARASSLSHGNSVVEQ